MNGLTITYSAIRCDGLNYLHLPKAERPYSHHIEATDTAGNTVSFILHGDSEKELHFRLRGNERLMPKDFVCAEMASGNRYCPFYAKSKNDMPIFAIFNKVNPEFMSSEAEIIRGIIKQVVYSPLCFEYGNNGRRVDVIV